MGMSFLFDGDTAYGHYRVEDGYYGGRLARVLYSGKNEAAQSGIARDDNDDLLFDYNQRFMELLRGLKPASLLQLGGGALTLPTALMREFPALAIDIVEIDKELIGIAKRFFDFRPNGRTAVHIGDGSQYLQTSSNVYDAILVDVFMNTEIPRAFQTIGFARSVAAHLHQGGVVAINCIGSLNGQRSTVIRRIVDGLRAVFDEVQIFPAGHELPDWMPQNYVITAQNGSFNIAAHMRYRPVTLPPA